MNFLKVLFSLILERIKDKTITELVQAVLAMYAAVKDSGAIDEAARDETLPTARNIGGDFKAQLRGAVTTYYYQQKK